ncbi:MAG: hypothetical protein HZRFUVUK_001195 [Candidatus Fervidibacterota bacterium]|jgi:hypothetical protein
MWDGHTALKHEVVRGPETRDGFSFCLTYTYSPDGERFFVFHIASDEPLSESARKWLSLMGLQNFDTCPHLWQRPCFWKAVNERELVSSSDPWVRRQQVRIVYNAFDQLCQNFAKALSELESASKVLSDIGLSL